MISTRQKWALGGLLSLCAAVWTPLLFARAGGETSSEIGPEGPTDAEMALIEGGMGSAFPSGPSPRSAQRPATSGDAAVGNSNSSKSPAATNAAGDVLGPDELVRSIAVALGSSRTYGGATGADAAQDALRFGTPGDPGSDGGEELAAEDDVASSSAMLTFLGRHPLRGTLVGATTAHALFGPHRVGEGDLLPGTAATVASIQRGRVIVEEAGMSIELELEPLRTSDARMRAAREANAIGTVGGLPSDAVPTGPGPVVPTTSGEAAPGPLSPAIENAPVGGL